MQLILSQGHSYAAVVAVASTFVLLGQTVQVGKYRKLAKVPYPHMSCTPEECDKDTNKQLFNCAQRVHGNTLEGFPIYMTLYVLSAAVYPEFASGCGLFWIIGRIFYSRGYLTGKPEKRVGGVGVGLVGLIGLLGASIKVCYDLFSL